MAAASCAGVRTTRPPTERKTSSTADAGLVGGAAVRDAGHAQAASTGGAGLDADGQAEVGDLRLVVVAAAAEEHADDRARDDDDDRDDRRHRQEHRARGVEAPHAGGSEERPDRQRDHELGAVCLRCS